MTALNSRAPPKSVGTVRGVLAATGVGVGVGFGGAGSSACLSLGGSAPVPTPTRAGWPAPGSCRPGLCNASRAWAMSPRLGMEEPVICRRSDLEELVVEFLAEDNGAGERGPRRVVRPPELPGQVGHPGRRSQQIRLQCVQEASLGPSTVADVVLARGGERDQERRRSPPRASFVAIARFSAADGSRCKSSS